jgi:hypothetical protein
LKSKAITPTLFKGNCNGPAHCCLATFHPTTSTLFVNQLHKLQLQVVKLALNRLGFL